MRTFRLGSDGDLVIENGEMQMVEGVEELVQCIRIELTTFKGEWFLDGNMGVDYYGIVLVKNPNYEAIRAELTRVILREPRIRTVDSLEFILDRIRRTLSVSFKATARDGQMIEVNEVMIGA